MDSETAVMISRSLGWDAPPDRPVLEAGDVHIWRVSLEAASLQAPKFWGLLASDEIKRAQTFHFSRDRDRFVTVRGILKMLLGTYLGTSPREIEFHYGPRGKPALSPQRAGAAPSFNVSHSHDMALLAFTLDLSVGIDVERIRPEVAREQIAERFFSAQETAALCVLPESLQPAAFFNCWTRKEAFIKATGDGLSMPLDQFSMSLVPGEPARLLEVKDGHPELSHWLIRELDVGSGYAAALAVQNPVEQIFCWEYPPSRDCLNHSDQSSSHF